MKKLFALAALFAVLGVSAQQKSEVPSQERKAKKEMRMDKNEGQRGDKKGEKKERPSIEERVNKFDQYGVSSSQKKKIKALYEKRETQMKKDFEKESKDQMVKAREDRKAKKASFDKEMEKILSKKQFAQYQEDQEKKFAGKDKGHMNGKFGSKEDFRAKKS